VKVVFVLGLALSASIYPLTAPPIAPPQHPPKLQFDGRSALRKRPSLVSAPIAYSKAGTRLPVLRTEGDWVQVQIEGSINGWTQRDQGEITPPPLPQLTPRQRAKQQLHNLFEKVHGLF
jgi:hypothetical protein